MESETLEMRIYPSEGTIQSFVLRDPSQITAVRGKLEPSRLFASPRLVIAGETFKSLFLTSRILRIDFVDARIQLWDFPSGYADIVDLTEEEFRRHAHLDEPELMAKRQQCTPVGDLLVSFIELVMTGGTRYFLMTEFPVRLPQESQSFMRLVLSSAVLHMRLACGGVGIVNLANLVSYTIYPGIAQAPSDTWIAERLPES